MVIAAAERRAREVGLGADRVLIYSDAITEDAYLAELAGLLGTRFESLTAIARSHCPLGDDDLIQAAVTGLLPVTEAGRTIWIVAPRCLTARWLVSERLRSNSAVPWFRLTSSERLWRFVMAHAGRALGRHAVDELRKSRPLLSNAPSARRKTGTTKPSLLLNSTLALSTLATTLLPDPAIGLLAGQLLAGVSVLLSAVFLAATLLRFAMLTLGRRTVTPRRVPDRGLPIYTVICALYREAPVLDELVAAIRNLDYPAEKLDVKLVLEPDDIETRQAVERLELGPPFEIVFAPPIGPRTKPKALNAALALARGTYTVVYDAEDKPQRDQLRQALHVFESAGRRLACVQATLTIDNTADGWLARMFTANYAGQFDVFLPGLSRLKLPFPLGGSSNHFRTDVLREVGGWDPFNVTEDADLGIRLHRLGYHSTAIASATYEEAPAHLAAWLRQRTRWYKGWMQTWIVHTRRPRQLVRDLGVKGAAAFQFFLAWNVLAALVHPFCMASLAYSLAAAPNGIGRELGIYFAALVSGYVSTVALDLIGLMRRGLITHAWVLLLTPVYWLLLSAAAWRAVYQLFCAPLRWEKTEHGLARTSRLSALDC
jgi:cellulose synthase/poly-beta-1,6-N-acetylglucosamine synthase-like glycosyltransferase